MILVGIGLAIILARIIYIFLAIKKLLPKKEKKIKYLVSPVVFNVFNDILSRYIAGTHQEFICVDIGDLLPMINGESNPYREEALEVMRLAWPSENNFSEIYNHPTFNKQNGIHLSSWWRWHRSDKEQEKIVMQQKIKFLELLVKRLKVRKSGWDFDPY